MKLNISPEVENLLGKLDDLGISSEPYGESGQLRLTFFDTGFPFRTSDVLCMLPCLNPSSVFEIVKDVGGTKAREVHFLISPKELSYEGSIKGMEKFIKNANEILESQANSERR